MSQTNLNMMRSFTHPTKPVFVHEYKTNQQQLGEMESNPLLLSVNNLNRPHESASKELTLQNLNTLTKSLQTNIYNQVSLQKQQQQQQLEQLQMGNFNKHDESPIFNNVNHHHHNHFQQQQHRSTNNNNNNELGPSSSTSATASVANANVNNASSSAANASIMVEEQLSQNKGAMKLQTFWYAMFYIFSVSELHKITF